MSRVGPFSFPLIFAVAVALTARAEPVPVQVRLRGVGEEVAAADAVTVPLAFPGQIEVDLLAPSAAWARASHLLFRLDWPDDMAPGAQVLVLWEDADFTWFQYLAPDPLSPGTEVEVSVRLDTTNGGWTGHGHRAAWSRLHRLAPRAVGLRLFAASAYEGEARLHSVRLIPEPAQQPPPQIRHVRASASSVPRYERVQIDFQLTDRYIDPFDPDEVEVTGLFEGPGGETVRMDGFFRQEFYRVHNAHGERLVPQGRPGWSLRFTPLQEGEYRYRIRVRDRWGEAEWGPGLLTALPAVRNGFVQVSAADPRFFEYGDGTFFFPIGHNIRSTFDERHDHRFPWEHRERTGTAAYRDYFEGMAASGQNFVEVWMASWSLGLEWSPVRPGYRGIGWFNLRHAWELDRVVEWAEEFGLHINLVIHNHGKFSSWVDQEWDANPFNTALGGYLEHPQDYFTDPRAKEAFRKLMRYTLARWSASPAIFSWELWNELDLTGTRGQNPRVHQDPTTVEWHEEMGRWIRERDPYRTLIGTHVCGNYTHQNPALVGLEVMDFAPINAYHRETNPVHIVDLLRQSAEYNAQFGKPVLVTEFGGSPSAHQGVRHLEDELFAALWASTAVPVAGTPLFWWWHLIAEEGWYRKYAAVSRFMEGIDRRNSQARFATGVVRVNGEERGDIRALLFRSPEGGNGWIYGHDAFPRLDPDGDPLAPGAEVVIEGLVEGAYQIEFWDTLRGERTGTIEAFADGGRLVAPLPAFGRDVALKFQWQP